MLFIESNRVLDPAFEEVVAHLDRQFDRVADCFEEVEDPLGLFRVFLDPKSLREVLLEVSQHALKYESGKKSVPESSPWTFPLMLCLFFRMFLLMTLWKRSSINLFDSTTLWTFWSRISFLILRVCSW